MKNIIKKFEKVIIGLDARKARKAVSELKKAGKMTASEGKSLLSDLMRETHNAQKRMSGLIDRHYSMAMKHLKGSSKKVKRAIRR